MEQVFSSSSMVSQTEKEKLKFSSWIEVNLDALACNLQQIEGKTTAPILPVIKGNAYGHGAPVVAAFLQSLGYNFLGVSSLEEALTILEFTKPTLLLLTPPTPSQLDSVLRHNIVPTITSPPLLKDLANRAQKQKKQVTVHLKLDTGFGRLGSTARDCLEMVDLIKKIPHLHLGGIFTHFSMAFRNPKYTLKQLDSLLAIKDELGNENPEITWHAANSAALINLPASHLDLVRIGTLLYGQTPVALDASWELSNTWLCKARVLQIRKIPKGHFIGYDGTYKTKKPTVVGVVSLGFSQGLGLQPIHNLKDHFKHVFLGLIRNSKTGFLFQDKLLPVMGKIAMGLTCVNLDTAPEVQVGTELIAPMRRVTSNPQLPHVYQYQGQTYCIFWNNKVYFRGLWRTRLDVLFSKGSPLPCASSPAQHSHYGQ